MTSFCIDKCLRFGKLAVIDARKSKDAWYLISMIDNLSTLVCWNEMLFDGILVPGISYVNSCREGHN